MKLIIYHRKNLTFSEKILAATVFVVMLAAIYAGIYYAAAFMSEASPQTRNIAAGLSFISLTMVAMRAALHYRASHKARS